MLPIYEIEPSLRKALAAGGRIIITAPTGSGKSTQVPQMLLKILPERSGEIIVLQPRRIAARLLAHRVAQEMGVPLGSTVGYQVRFERRDSPETRIKYITEGILLRRMLDDPYLNGVAAVVFDEFHERHLYGDITLAQAVELQETTRPDLLIIVMSATLNVELLTGHLKTAQTLASSGRTFPVDVRYLEKPSDAPIWDQAVDALEENYARVQEGNVLVFMPGSFEIKRTIQRLLDSPVSRGFAVLPLHGDLPLEAQAQAVSPDSGRKIIVATNVAETSLTIDGVRFVVDGGLARIPKFDPYRGINTLWVEKISRASSDQRAGRAGRTAPGVCLRLWTEQEHRGRPLQEAPEIKRLDLAEVVLTLKGAGRTDLNAFRWVEPPDPKSLERAEQLLKDLGALDTESGAITALGRRLLAFPLHPRYARMLLAAGERSCVRAIALIAALTQGRDLLLRTREKDTREQRGDTLGDEERSDFFRLMRAWQYAQKNNFALDACRRLGIHAVSARQVGPLFESFLNIARNEGLDVDARPKSDDDICKCILTGFADHLARRMDGGTLRCEIVHGRRGMLARESVVRNSTLVVAAEVREVEGRPGDVNTLLTLVTAVESAWLDELFPGDMTEKIEVEYDEAARRVLAWRRRKFRDLALESHPSDEIPGGQAAALLAERVIAGQLVLHGWTAEVDQWLQRVNHVAATHPETGVPAVTPDDRRAMVEQVCLGSFSYKDLKDKPVWPVVQDWLNYPQRAAVEKLAPERFELPGGRKAKIVYAVDGPPYIAARIQDLYGLNATPSIGGGRVPLTVHILAPSQRPVQITRDLPGFWREHYPNIKRELQRKYPKHEWR